MTQLQEETRCFMNRVKREKRIRKEEKEYILSLSLMIAGLLLFALAILCGMQIENIGLALLSSWFVGMVAIFCFGSGFSYFWDKAKDYISLFLSKKGV